MCRGQRDRRFWRVKQEQTVTISLELALAGDTLSGRGTSAGHQVRDFTGWIGLMGAIESLLESGVQTQTRSSTKSSSDTGGKR
jgi:hypothetical protein